MLARVFYVSGAAFCFRQVQRGEEAPFNVPPLWFEDNQEGSAVCLLSEQDLNPSLWGLGTLGDPPRRSWTKFQPLH